MQKIKFITSIGTVEIDDVNTSSIGGEYRKLWLSDFDGNSQNLILNTVRCIGMDGQRTISAVRDTKIITADITFTPLYYENNRLICRGERGMHELRREILRLFPLGVSGILEYSNDSGNFQIGARIDEAPKITVRDGWLCECKILFTADYPYWSKTVVSDSYEVTAGESVTITSEAYGDMESPVSGIITCIEALGESDSGVYFALENADGNNAIRFVKPMTEGQQLKFSLEFNNKFEILTRLDEDSEWVNAYEYLRYSELWQPCRNRAAPTDFKFSVFSDTGKLGIVLNYHNLFTAI